MKLGKDILFCNPDYDIWNIVKGFLTESQHFIKFISSDNDRTDFNCITKFCHNYKIDCNILKGNFYSNNKNNIELLKRGRIEKENLIILETR